MFSNDPSIIQDQVSKALSENNLNKARELLELGGGATTLYKTGRTALTQAAGNGLLETVRFLLSESKPGTINHQDKYDSTALIRAAANGHSEMVRFLLESKAAMDYRDNGGRTALRAAVDNGQDKVVSVLLAHDEAATKDARGMAALLTSATKNRHLRVVRLLIERWGGVAAIINDDTLMTAICHAHNKTSEIPLELLKYDEVKKTINKIDPLDGFTALMYAAHYNLPKVVSELLKHKAEIHHQTEYGKTALTLATTYNRTKIVKMLKEKQTYEDQLKIMASTFSLFSEKRKLGEVDRPEVYAPQDVINIMGDYLEPDYIPAAEAPKP